MGVQPLPGNKQPQSLSNTTGGGAPPAGGNMGGATSSSGGTGSSASGGGGLGIGGRGQSATEQLVQMPDKPSEKERDPTQNIG